MGGKPESRERDQLGMDVAILIKVEKIEEWGSVTIRASAECSQPFWLFSQLYTIPTCTGHYGGNGCLASPLPLWCVSIRADSVGKLASEKRPASPTSPPFQRQTFIKLETEERLQDGPLSRNLAQRDNQRVERMCS